MKNLSELFEFLSFCDNDTILKEVKNHGKRLIRLNGSKAAPKLKLDIEKLNTLFRLSEWYLNDEFHSDMKDVVVAPEGDEIMTVKEAAKYLKTTSQTIYDLISKDKIDKMVISTVDKPNARASLRLRKKDIDNFVNNR